MRKSVDSEIVDIFFYILLHFHFNCYCGCDVPSKCSLNLHLPMIDEVEYNFTDSQASCRCSLVKSLF